MRIDVVIEDRIVRPKKAEGEKSDVSQYLSFCTSKQRRLRYTQKGKEGRKEEEQKAQRKPSRLPSFVQESPVFDSCWTFLHRPSKKGQKGKSLKKKKEYTKKPKKKEIFGRKSEKARERSPSPRDIIVHSLSSPLDRLGP